MRSSDQMKADFYIVYMLLICSYLNKTNNYLEFRTKQAHRGHVFEAVYGSFMHVDQEKAKIYESFQIISS